MEKARLLKEVGFESVDGFNVPDVRGERVPEARGRIAEGSSPHGG